MDNFVLQLTFAFLEQIKLMKKVENATGDKSSTVTDWASRKDLLRARLAALSEEPKVENEQQLKAYLPDNNKNNFDGEQ